MAYLQETLKASLAQATSGAQALAPKAVSDDCLLPFRGKISHSRLQLYLSAAAGVMLGASFFHVMPDAMEMAGDMFGWWMALGAVGLFCIERFIAQTIERVKLEGFPYKYTALFDDGKPGMGTLAGARVRGGRTRGGYSFGMARRR